MGRGLIAVVASLAVLSSPAVVATAATAAPLDEAPATELNEMFGAYGDTSGSWNGGDSTASVRLPDGRTVWLFSDTFIGPINEDGSRPHFQPLIHNSMVVQDGDELVRTLTGGTADEPASLVGGESDAEPTNAGYWVADGTVEGSTLRVLYNHYRRTGSHALDVELTGTVLATFDLPDLTLRSTTPLPLSHRIAWGSAILEDGDTTYIYGASLLNDAGPVKSVYLARVDAGGLAGPWQFWDGTGWSASESDAARLMGGVTTAFGVQKVAGEYVMVTVEGNLLFNSEVVAYTAGSPTGPFTGPVSLFRAPEPQPGREIIVYDARTHPELARAGTLLVSYNVNSLAIEDNQTDARLYRPRFVEVDWPLPTPDPSTLPPAPTDLVATPDDQSGIALTWTATPGATSYRIYQRDIANGQSHPARLPASVTSPAFTGHNLQSGHLYEYSIAAVNDNGEGARSEPVTAIARSEPAQEGVFVAAPADTAVAGEYIVDLRDDAAGGKHGLTAIADRLVARYGGTLGPVYSDVVGGFSVSGMTDAEARQLATDPAVTSVEEDRTVTMASGGVQTDPPSWGLDRIDGTLDGKFVYPGTGEDIPIYIVDTGIRLGHTDFGNRATFGFSRFENPDSPVYQQCGEHGTFVAGVAGGSSYGVAKEARLVSVQVDCQKILTAGHVLAGVNWATRDHAPEEPAVMNLSLRDRSASREAGALRGAVADAVEDGITVVASAGNEGVDECEMSVPAGMEQVITVAATTQDDQRWEHSNIGSCVDIFAPGAGITSARHDSDTGAATLSGTSAAAPHVAGAAALVLSAHPHYTPAEVEQAIVGVAESGVVGNPGLNTPNRLLRLEPPVNAAPQNLTATPADDGTIDLSWEPVATGGVHYLVSQRDATAGQEAWTWETPVRTGTTAVASDLEPGHTYEFTVAAANTMAVGPQSNVASAESTVAPPPAPENLTATASGNGTILLTWDEPQADAWYWVYQRDLTLGDEEFAKLPLPITACCEMVAQYLTHGHEYEYKVSATNRGGEGPASEPASAEAFFDAPSPPTHLRAEPGDGQATLTWDPSPTEGVWYHVYQRDATENEDWQKLPLPITECCTMPALYLANGHEYDYKVTAIRGSESLASNVVSVTPMPPLPGQPTNLQLEPLDTGEIALSWDAPGPNLYYRVYWRDVTAGETTFRRSEVPTDSNTATWGYLTHEHVYEFKVTGENLAGEGPASDPAQATSRVARPDAPTNLRAVAAGNLEIALSWDAPGPNVLYWVYWRDVTAGETTFQKSQYPTDATEATWQYLTYQHVYEFKVSATNVAGEGPTSVPARAKATGQPPEPPTDLRATPGNGVVRLNWSPSPTSGAGYVVYYRNVSDGQSWQRMPYPVNDCCTITMEYLTNGDTYAFRVAAANAVGESKRSNVVTARPLPPFPQPPSNLRATGGDGEVRLTWSASPTPGVYYWIEYRKAGGSWKRLKYPVGDCCSFTQHLLVNGTTYYYRVRATNVAGDSSPSNVDSARPMPPFPRPPSNLSATNAGDGKVRLTWSPSPTRNVWYLIEYRKSGGWVRMRYPVTDCCSITMKYLTNGATYQFRVRATNLAGDSAASNVDSARPMPPFPRPPSRLRADAGDNEVKLTWSASPTPNVLYYVYVRDATLAGWWERLPYPTDQRSITVEYLGNGHYYDFKVTAVNLAGESGRSNIVTAMPRWADGTSRSAGVTSSWILADYGGFDPIQRYDVSASIRGVRSGDYLRVTGDWHTNNGKRLLEGIFWYNVIDCTLGYSVTHRTLEYPTGSTVGSGGIGFSYRMHPQHMYAVQVHGTGSVTYSGGIYGRFAMYPQPGIIPFVRQTACF